MNTQFLCRLKTVEAGAFESQADRLGIQNIMSRSHAGIVLPGGSVAGELFGHMFYADVPFPTKNESALDNVFQLADIGTFTVVSRLL